MEGSALNLACFLLPLFPFSALKNVKVRLAGIERAKLAKWTQRRRSVRARVRGYRNYRQGGGHC